MNNYPKLLILVSGIALSAVISSFGQGNLIPFNTIPKDGTYLIYAHMDDDLIWMLPFWRITEKFIGGAMPATPSYRTIVNQQQGFLNGNGYNIPYESNWITPWTDISDKAYTEYYWGINSSYSYLVNDHLLAKLYSDRTDLSRYEINKIKAKLEQYFASPELQRVITHNNWGETGHRHHVGLNKAVRELAVKYRKDVWMLGCDNGGFVDVNVPAGITYTIGSFNLPSLYTGIRTIYNNNGRWTWHMDRIPNGDHKFIKIVDRGIDKSNILKGDEITYTGPSQLEAGAYLFDGYDDYMTLPGNNFRSFTISMRIRPEEIRAMDIFAMSEYPGSSLNDRNIYLTSDGRVAARIYDGTSRSVTSGHRISPDTWSHIVITGNGNSLRLYINGIREASINAGTAIINYSTPEIILGQAIITVSYFSGQISDLRLFDYALSDNEISRLNNSVIYNISSSAGQGGVITPSGVVTVSPGTSRTLMIVPDEGYRISDVLVDNHSIGAVSSYTFNNINSDHSISATFEHITFLINSGQGTGGTISPAGSVTVDYGADATFLINPATGYDISEIRVDGNSVGKVSAFTFTRVVSNHSIYATFTPKVLIISSSSGSGGLISPSGDILLDYGASQNYSINPGPGFQIADVLVDNISFGPVSDYSFTDVRENHTIRAIFKLLTYTITVSSNDGGSVSPAGIEAEYGSDETFLITPDPGYKITEVKVDNSSLGPVTSYTFSNITASHTLSVTFKALEIYTIEADAGPGGSISPSGTTRLTEGSDQSFVIIPDNGFRICEVVIDGESAGSLSDYTFNNLASDHTIGVSFTNSTDVSVYPNPFREELNIIIAAPGEDQYELRITDVTGRLIFSNYEVPGNTLYPVHLNGVPGMYIIRICNKGRKIATCKVIRF